MAFDIMSLLEDLDKMDQSFGQNSLSSLDKLFGGNPQGNTIVATPEQQAESEALAKRFGVQNTTVQDPQQREVAQRQAEARDWNKDTRRGLGKTLGDIADVLLMLDGGRPVFAEANKQERMNEAGREYANDPEGLAKALYGIDYGSGQKYTQDRFKNLLDAQKENREGGTATLNNAQTILENQQKALSLAGQFLRSSDPKSKEGAADFVNGYLKDRGIMNITVPKDYDDNFINNLSLTPNEFVTAQERRRTNDSMIGDRAHQQRIDEGNIKIRGIAEDRDYEIGVKRNEIAADAVEERRRHAKEMESKPRIGDERVKNGIRYKRVTGGWKPIKD